VPEDFASTIAAAYATEAPAIVLGRGVHEGAVSPEAVVQVPLPMMNRHGLITGATGTGKTKTLQVIAEQLSAAGVPVFVADVKGDVSGLAAPGEAGGAAEKRAADIGVPFAPAASPVEYLSLGGIGPGVPVRATVADFGPQLLGKILGANETQEQSLTLVFHYADQKGLPLLDLSDLRALLTYLDSDEGKPELKGIGGLSPATVGVLLRSLVGVETGGGSEFFGEPQLDVADLLRTTPEGRGVISCLELPAVQDKPKLWSTVLMWLVAELFESLPEAGDLPKPKLVFFLDEAHLLFADSTEAFRESIEQTVRLIRSKGVGVFFVTQSSEDVPGTVLAQLGNRVQHAVRAFTPADAKALKATVSTFPKSDLYDLEELLPQLGIGEAAVTILSETGVPTPVVHTRLMPPMSRMAPADGVEAAAKASPLHAKYAERVDAQSAREQLAGRLAEAADAAAEPDAAAEAPAEPAPDPPARRRRRKEEAEATQGGLGQLGDFLTSREGKRVQKQVMRGVFGMLRKRL
jgi:hypothetical protein